jgi:hypothetical protein
MKTILCLMLIATSAAHAADVRVVKDESLVASCTVVSEVQSNPPYWTFDAALKQVKKHAAQLHADTILITHANMWFTTAIAYRCNDGK